MDLELYYKYATKAIELVLALTILISVIIFLLNKIALEDLVGLGTAVSIENLISDALLMILGLELVRLLITPSIKATLELMVFVVARKTLTPSISSLDLLFNIIAFTLLILVNYVCIKGKVSSRFKKMLVPTKDKKKK